MIGVGLAARCFIAPFQGTARWCGDAELRRLALRPLLVGAVVYCFTLIGVFYSHDWLYAMLTPSWSGFWLAAIKPFSWLLSWLLLLGVGLVAALSASIAVAGIYHEQMAETVFRRAGQHQSAEARSGSRPLEAGRVVAREIIKLGIIITLSLCSLVIGLLPGVAPLALLFNSWLIGFEIVDLASGVLGVSFRSRLRWTLRNGAAVASLGAALLIVGFIPFAPLLLAPGAVAGFAGLAATLSGPDRTGLIPTASA